MIFSIFWLLRCLESAAKESRRFQEESDGGRISGYMDIVGYRTIYFYNTSYVAMSHQSELGKMLFLLENEG